MSLPFDPFHRTIVDDVAPVPAPKRKRLARAVLLSGSSALVLTVALGRTALVEGF